MAKPSPPSKPVIEVLGLTSVLVSFGDGASVGKPILSRQIGFNTTGNMVGGTIRSADNVTPITGLAPGVRYNFWARNANADGMSDWSPGTGQTMPNVPSPPTTPILTPTSQTTMMVDFTAGAANGAAILGYEIAWNTTDTLTGAHLGDAEGPREIGGLPPGGRIYVWVRQITMYGASAWSPVALGKTFAGAFVHQWESEGVITMPVDAVPYVNVGGVAATDDDPAIPGVWKLVEPYTRFYGIFKKPW